MNLRKDHYRCRLLVRRAPEGEAHHTLPRWRGVYSAPPAQRPLKLGQRGRARRGTGGSREERSTSGQLNARRRLSNRPSGRLRASLGSGLRVSPSPPLPPFFFRSPKQPHSRLRARLRAGPRAPVAGRVSPGTYRPGPGAQPVAASRVSHNSPALPRSVGGVFKVPAAGNGDRGAPGGLCRLGTISCETHTSRNQGLEQKQKSTTLSGGSLGSRVDEERS